MGIMDLARFRDRIFWFELATYIGFTIGFFTAFFNNGAFNLFHVIHLAPIIILLLRNIDLSKRAYLDEYLVGSIIGLVLGIIIIDWKNYSNFIIGFNPYAYLLTLFAYFYITYVINKIIKDIWNREK